MPKQSMIKGGILVAAGMSSRMGDFKPLLPYRNTTIIQAAIENMQNAGVEEIIVVVGHRGQEIEAVIQSMQHVKIVFNPNYAKGDMLESIQLGLGQIKKANAVYFMPADMPAIAVETFVKVWVCMEKTGAAVVFPTLLGRKKHPVLVGKACFKAILTCKENGGLRVVLEQYVQQTQYVPVTDQACGMDIDTPDDYQKLLDWTRQQSSLE